MPGGIQTYTPTVTMAGNLCFAFQRSQNYLCYSNPYASGEVERAMAVTSSRKHWRLRFRLPSSLMQALRLFYEQRYGPLVPFYFYDVYETSPKFTPDPTGVATAGRYKARFASDWQQDCGGPVRSIATIELIETA